MKKILFAVITLSILSFSYAPGTYGVDKSASIIHWYGKKTTGEHYGDIKLQSGTLNFQTGVPTAGEFVIDMTTISVSDIKDPGDNKDLVDHLKKDDFFGVSNFPTAKIVIKKFEPLKKGEVDNANYRATADLTIKGITNQIQFPAQIDITGADVKAAAKITIDRTKWKIVYKSKTIFSSLGDKFIYDDVTFNVNLVLHASK